MDHLPHARRHRRALVARALTDTVAELFTPSRPLGGGDPAADDGSVHQLGEQELPIGGEPATGESAGVTVELSDWSIPPGSGPAPQRR